MNICSTGMLAWLQCYLSGGKGCDEVEGNQEQHQAIKVLDGQAGLVTQLLEGALPSEQLSNDGGGNANHGSPGGNEEFSVKAGPFQPCEFRPPEERWEKEGERPIGRELLGRKEKGERKGEGAKGEGAKRRARRRREEKGEKKERERERGEGKGRERERERNLPTSNSLLLVNPMVTVRAFLPPRPTRNDCAGTSLIAFFPVFFDACVPDSKVISFH